jgi:hypothetical protein
MLGNRVIRGLGVDVGRRRSGWRPALRCTGNSWVAPPNTCEFNCSERTLSPTNASSLRGESSTRRKAEQHLLLRGCLQRRQWREALERRVDDDGLESSAR